MVSNTTGTKDLGGHSGMNRGTKGVKPPNPQPPSISTLELVMCLDDEGSGGRDKWGDIPVDSRCLRTKEQKSCRQRK